jgi:RHS repeat-associated protein
VTTNTYNGDGELTSTLQPNGGTISYTYNGDDEKTAETDANGKTTTYSYSPLGKETSEVAPGGQTTSFTYDLNGNKISETDPDNNTTTYTYDLDNQLLTETEPGGTELTYTYDLDGNKTSDNDGAGDTTTYAYNTLDQLTGITDPLGHSTSFSYNDNGQKSTETNANGQTTTWGYNADNQVNSITYSDGTTSVGYVYDPDGNVTQMTDASGETTYAYNADDQLTSSTNGAGDAVSYAYDPAGHVTSLTYPNTKSVTRTFNSMGELASVTDWNGNKTTFAYDNDGDETAIDYPNGITDTSTYNSADQLTGITDTQGSTTVLGFSYSLNSDGLITSETDTGTPDAGTTNYSYNGLNELTAAGSSSYTYSTAKDLTTGPGGATQAFNADDELCWSATSSGSSCSSPPSGATTYAWNQNDELTGYTPASGSSISYTYDGNGLLEDEIEAGTTHNFTWDTEASTPQLLELSGPTYYIYGNGTAPIEQISSTGAATYLLADQLGSTRAVANSSGSLVETLTYNPWGGVQASTGSLSTVFLYAGEYVDLSSGLYYPRARWYDDATGQFMSLDPDIMSTESPFAYTGDNPVNGTDPDGLWSLNPISDIGEALGDVGEAAGSIIDAPITIAAAIGGVIAVAWSAATATKAGGTAEIPILFGQRRITGSFSGGDSISGPPTGNKIPVFPWQVGGKPVAVAINNRTLANYSLNHVKFPP